MPRHRRNPLPKAPPKRRFAGQPSPQQLSSSLARVRKLARDLPENERSFDPARGRGSWQGSSRDLVVNGGKMDSFTRAFFETALWSSTDNSRDDGGDPLDKNYSISDIDPATVQKLSAECARFQEENADAISQGADATPVKLDWHAGYDFWLTRCGHGAGFWDGDWPEPAATQLTEASEAYGNVDLYIGDDGVIYGAGYEPNGEQQHFPWGSKRAGALEIPMPEFDWEQIDGDMDVGGHGGTIARSDGTSIELVEIQPVREYVGDGEAKEVGYPFWIKEAYYDLDDLNPSNPEVAAALESSDIDLDEVDPKYLARTIASACMRYGHRAEEANGGWAGEKKEDEDGEEYLLGDRLVRWQHGSSKPTTFEDECGSEDDEFRREVLGTIAPFTYKMTYETWNEEALEAGETDDKGWLEKGSAEYDSLEELLNASEIRNHNWIEWSDSNPDGKRSWLIAEDEEDNRTGDRTTHNLWIERADGEPKTQEEIDTINEKLGISTFGRMRRNKSRR